VEQIEIVRWAPLALDGLEGRHESLRAHCDDFDLLHAGGRVQVTVSPSRDLMSARAMGEIQLT